MWRGFHIQRYRSPPVAVSSALEHHKAPTGGNLTSEMVGLQAGIGMRSIHNIVEEQSQDSELVINESDAGVILSQRNLICKRQNMWSMIADLAQPVGAAVVHEEVPC